MPTIRSQVFRVVPRVLLICCLFACSKDNQVAIDVDDGELPAGSECVVMADDPCAGACVEGVCRLACGVNRECPGGSRCVGDGNAAGCVPDDAGEPGALDLLSDCDGGCQLELPEFGREGTFYRCRMEGSELEQIRTQLAYGRPSIDPITLCREVLHTAYAVAGDEMHMLDPAGNASCAYRPFGVKGDAAVGFARAAEVYVGYLYEQGDTTYMLAGDGLFRFETGTVAALPGDCWDPGITQFPAVGELPSELTGLWAKCPDVVGALGDVDLSACASLEYGVGGWGDTWSLATLRVREDGYGTDAWLGRGLDGVCSNAFRKAADLPGAMLIYRRSEVYITVETEYWLTEEWEGETFMQRSVNGNFNFGEFYRRIPVPAELGSDPCDDRVPSFEL